MPDGQTALLRLIAWLSPAFPVGSFSYSHGLETAAHGELVGEAAGLRQWLVDLIERGSAWNDAVLFAEAHRRMGALVNLGPSEQKDPPLACRPSPPQGGRLAAQSVSPIAKAGDEAMPEELPISPLEGEMAGRPEGGASALPENDPALAELCELAEALAGSRERHVETMLQGSAFLKAAAAWPHPSLAELPADCAYPVAVGAVAGAHGVDLRFALSAFLQAFASNQIQAAIRLGIIGQVDAMATLASLEMVLSDAAGRATQSTLDDLGSATMMAEIAAMQHETHYSRLFRT